MLSLRRIMLAFFVGVAAFAQAHATSSTVGASTYSTTVLGNSPIAYWRLGETSGSIAADSTGNGHRLLYYGAGLGKTGAIAGDTNAAVGLAGTTGSYIISNPYSGFPSTAFTVEGWVKTTGSSYGIFSYAVSGNTNRVLLYSPENIHVTDGASYLTTGVSVNDGQWHYLAWTWRASDGQTQLYKDGALKFTGYLGKTSIPSTGSLVLGQDQDTVGGGFQSYQSFNGTLDDFALYGTVLSATQIQAHYTAAGGTVSSGPTPSVYLGVSITNVPYDMTLLNNFQTDAGRKMAIVSFWRTMGGSQSTLYTSWLDNVHNNGSTPMITWTPTNSDTGGAYSLTSIANGQLDSTITSWAKQLKSYGGRVLIRWAHEMNGAWYPWGQQASAYIAAWRHIHAIFANQGATNVQWVWCPNTEWSTSSKFDAYYPGDAYVDWVGLDSYNSPKNGAWETFTQLFGSSYTDITTLTSKPVLIGETSSAEANIFSPLPSSTKAQWITTTFGTTLPALPRIKAIVWMNDNLTASEGCCDWRIESSSAAKSAFAQAISSSYYISYWP